MNKLFIILLLFAVQGAALGQQLLTTEEAVQITLANNYNILLAKNATAIAENNTGRYNTGELPTVRFNTGMDYGVSGTEIDYNDPIAPSVSNWVTNGVDYNASVLVNYLIYDFGGRELNKQRLREVFGQTSLEERRAIELNLLSTLISYYNIAQIRENLMAQEEVLEISMERKERAEYQFQYGKNNKLAVLNAAVDINRDSIDYLNLVQQLANEKRNFNHLLGRAVDTPFEIDTSLSFAAGLTLDQLLVEAMAKNTDLLLVDRQMQISELDIAINKTNLKPAISAKSALGLFGALNDNNTAVKNQFASDFAAGISLSWNLFDGGFTKVRRDNLQILMGNQQLLREQKKEQITRDVKNAWESYQNQLYIMQVELKNMETAALNFDRTADQFKVGQVSSVEFRQAQLNKLYAQINYNRAKFIAKINEVSLMQLSGNILEGI